MSRKRSSRTKQADQLKFVDKPRPFAEHLQELRTRSVYMAGSVLLFGSAAYFVQQHIVNLLLKPSHGQHFIYTSPIGGIGFLFQICTYVGITVSLPVIVYQLMRFLEPLLTRSIRRFIVRCTIASGFLGIIGLTFGYFLGLPLALHFLSHQFTTSQIQPLLTLSEYMSFVTIYLFGSALLFQVPVVLIIINRIKPQSPRRLLHLERYVIAGAFIIAMLMAPTVNVIDQLIIAGPLIFAYQVGIGLVTLINRKPPRRPKYVQDLVEHDRVVQAARYERQVRDYTGATNRNLQMRVRRQPVVTVPPVRRPVIMDFAFVRSQSSFTRRIIM